MVRFFLIPALLSLTPMGCKKIEPPVNNSVQTPASVPAVIAEVPPAEPPPRKRIPIPDDYVKLPKGHSSAEWEPEKYVELLCDPKTHRLSININPPEFRPNSGFAERKLIEIGSLVKWFESARYSGGVFEAIPRSEKCGDATIDFDPVNLRPGGMDGAHGVYVSVSASYNGVYLWNKFLTDNWLWSNRGSSSKDPSGCPAGYAERVDISTVVNYGQIETYIFVQSPDTRLFANTSWHFPAETKDFLHCNERQNTNLRIRKDV